MTTSTYCNRCGIIMKDVDKEFWGEIKTKNKKLDLCPSCYKSFLYEWDIY